MITRQKAHHLRALIEKAAVSLSDSDALDAVELFPVWAVGVWYDAGIRLRHNGILYRCRIAHTSQTGWEPPNVPALFEEVEEPGQGDTPDNPIPYNNNMELHLDKYYSQYSVVYRCIRDTGTAVYNDLADLVGIYVEVYS